MGKYTPLEQYLKQQKYSECPMTFAAIEDILGFNLPQSAYRHRAWWSNNTSNSVMTRAWLNAGFETGQVDMAGRKLVFRRRQPGTRGSKGNAPRPMASSQIVINDLAQEVTEALALRARQHRCSIEEEARRALTQAVILTPEDKLALSRRLRQQTPHGKVIDPAKLIREDRDSR